MKIKNITTINSHINLQAMCEQVTVGTASNNSLYLTLILKDNTGRIEARLWTVDEEELALWKVGCVYELEAVALLYKKKWQLKIKKAKLLAPGTYNNADFIETVPVDPQMMYDEIMRLIKGFTNQDYQKLMLTMMQVYKQSFLKWPAAVKNHHEIEGGLLWHSYTMLQSAIGLKKVYADRHIDWELLYCGVILHDLGKVKEIKYDVTSEFSMEGMLVGHISIMASRIYLIGQKEQLNKKAINLLQHMVLASHGKLEFGSPVLPKIIEAEILSLLDNLDARIYRISKEISKIDVDETTPRLFPLENRTFLNHFKNKDD